MPKFNLFEELKAAYAELDAHAEKIATQAKVSCTKGCANCCYMLATAAGIEGVNIAGQLLYVLNDQEFEGMLKDLRAMALKSAFPGMTNKNYFNRQVRCAFLTDNNLCSIYEVRPAACRYHLVISPKENCSPLALDTMTKAIDLRQLEAVIWDLDMQVNGGVPIMAPIPIAVMWGIGLVLTNTNHPRAQTLLPMWEKASEGILTPQEWMEKMGPAIAESTAKGTKRSIPLTIQGP